MPKGKRNRKNFRIIAGIKHYTACAAAKYLGISKGTLLNYSKEITIRNRMRRPLISNVLVGRQYFFLEKSLDDYLAERTKDGYTGRAQ